MADFKFDPEDVDSDGVVQNKNDASGGSPLESGSALDGGNILYLLFGIVSLYAFSKQSVVLAAVESLIGETTLSAAITTGFYIIGVAIAALISMTAVLGVIALVVGVVRQNGAALITALLPLSILGVSYVIAITVFSSHPVLVGIFFTFAVVAVAIDIFSIFVSSLAIIYSFV